MVAMDKVNLTDQFARITEPYVPYIVGELNGQQVKLARFRGPFIWHDHAHEDELFLVVEGQIRIELRDRVIELGPGELCVVPRGVEHRPVADAEACVLLFEPVSTVNTGDVQHRSTHTDLEWL
jgi:mannose-6-phosphate isomerase-like protein (cupin superfamily)